MHPLSRCFSCTECGVKFNNLHEVSSHKSNVHRCHKVFCKECAFTSVSKARMRQHVRVHMQGLQCSKCHLWCPSLSALLVHERLHSGDREHFECTVCLWSTTPELHYAFTLWGSMDWASCAPDVNLSLIPHLKEVSTSINVWPDS